MGHNVVGDGHIFTCDICGDKLEFEKVDFSTAMEWMRRNGWQHKGQAHFCPKPTCKPSDKPKEKWKGKRR